MARLALSAGDEWRSDDEALVLDLDDRASKAVFNSRREAVLFYRLIPNTLLMFVGTARVAGFTASVQHAAVWRFDDLRPFNNPVLSPGEVGAPGVRRMLSLSAERCSEILDAGSRRLSGKVEAEEGGEAFDLQERRVAVDTYLAIHDEVLRRWSYRCAVTGRQFAPGGRPHADLRLVAIRPRELGGPLHAHNYLPMIEMAERAWLDGAIGVGPGFDLLASLNHLAPELLEAIPQSGKLVLPENPTLWPDAGYLAFHRMHLFGLTRLNRPSSKPRSSA